MTCAACHRPLCGCTDAAWLGHRSSTPSFRATDSAQLSDIRLNYFHDELGITLIGMAAAGKASRVTHPGVPDAAAEGVRA